MQFLNDFSLYTSNLLTLALKILYPTYASYKAIKTADSNDDTTWLIYWVVVAVESFIGAYIIPFVSWVPFFMIVRVLFYIWLQIPIFNGSVILFNNFIKPFFEENQQIISGIIPGDREARERARQEMRQTINETYNEIYKSID